MLIESFGYSALKGYNKTVGLVHRIERLGKIKLEISMGKARKDGEDDVNVCHLDFMISMMQTLMMMLPLPWK
jgi:hypothetical protein